MTQVLCVDYKALDYGSVSKRKRLPLSANVSLRLLWCSAWKAFECLWLIKSLELQIVCATTLNILNGCTLWRVHSFYLLKVEVPNDHFDVFKTLSNSIFCLIYDDKIILSGYNFNTNLVFKTQNFTA